MAKYLDLNGLAYYDSRIRTYITDEMNEALTEALEEFSQALKFRNFISGSISFTVASNLNLLKPKVGDVWIVNNAANNVTWIGEDGTQHNGETLDIGDTLVCVQAYDSATGTLPRFGVLQGNWSVNLPQEAGQTIVPELAYAKDGILIATIGGVDIKVKTPGWINFKGTASAASGMNYAYRSAKVGDAYISTGATVDWRGPDGTNHTNVSVGAGNLFVCVKEDGNNNGGTIRWALFYMIKPLSVVANQSLSTTEKSNARTNLGLGTSATMDAVSSVEDFDGNNTGIVPTVAGVLSYLQSKGLGSDYPAYQSGVAYKVGDIFTEENKLWRVTEAISAAENVELGDVNKEDITNNILIRGIDGNIVDSGKKISDFKSVQTAKSSPTASGSAVAFIDTISQNAQGVITATKKNIRDASSSQSGLMSSAHYSKLEDIAAEATKDERITESEIDVEIFGDNPSGSSSSAS